MKAKRRRRNRPPEYWGRMKVTILPPGSRPREPALGEVLLDRKPQRVPRRGRTASRWRGLEGKSFVELVEDIQADGYSTKSGKKTTMPWKEVLRRLREMPRRVLAEEGYRVHTDAAKLKADFKVARDYWETAYSGAPFSTRKPRRR